jgi:hypothetical protein
VLIKFNDKSPLPSSLIAVTEELIRRKSEHNEQIVYTLEELSLHQEGIEKIENVQNYCRELKILLLQSNLIARIGNKFNFNSFSLDVLTISLALFLSLVRRKSP